MTSSQLNTLYQFESEIIAKITNFVQQQVRYEALSEQFLPVEQSLETLTKQYEYWKAHDDVGMAFEMDVVSPPDSDFAIERKAIQTPVVYSNVSLDFDSFQRVSRSIFSLQDRLAIHAGIMARRQDILTFVGDTKHGITGFNDIGTEITTAINVSTPALASSTIASAIDQLKASLKYSGTIGPQSTVIFMVTPDVWATASGVLTANFGTATPLDQINKLLKESFSANSRVVINHYLGATATIDENGRLSAFTAGSTKGNLYVQDPRIVKVLTSPVETRVSPIDPTKGVTFQPLKRFTRLDVETLGVLKETAVAGV